MADFQVAIGYVLSNEGGLEIDSNDPGGTTNFGISQRAYPDVNIRDLTRDQAVAIYEKDYWKFGGITDQRLATKIFDAYVNMFHNAIRVLQSSLHYLQVGPIVIDGEIGPNTISHVNATDSNQLLNEFKAQLVKFYYDDVAAHPAKKVFLLGWFRRAVKG